jgi:purine-cytosine permease-like protein
MGEPTKPASLVERLDALYEYEREPIKEKDLHGWKIFWATFAGEHIAGTEFVIGPLFVMHGCTAVDVLLGLLIGDLLAVLSWAFICAPIAVKTRLTQYWQLRKLGGPMLTVAYSAAFGVILCVLAGAMLRVSMTSIALPLEIHFAPPGQELGVLPQPVWIGLAVVVGSVIAILAVLGFEGMAIFSKMSAPWMVAVFFIAAIATLPALGCHSLSDFWWVAKEKIWTGQVANGMSKFTIWHVIGFAWLCNMPQHFGMGDMTILRYARKWQMGFCSSAGMYLGHYCAWIASGILCAAAMAKGIPTTPGPIAYLGAGLVGALCVVVAGWNVASPTLYRAGLALQVATPNWSRWRVTLVVGAGMIVCACIPAIISHLDMLLATNALLLLPLGAFILIDIRLFPMFGLKPNYAEITKSFISWPAALAWAGALAFSLFNYGKENFPFLHDHLAGRLPNWIAGITSDAIFLVLPEWLVAVGLYIVFSLIQQKMAGSSQPAVVTPSHENVA